jgi:hypothetical protein
MTKRKSQSQIIFESICKHSDDMKKADDAGKKQIMQDMAIETAILAKELNEIR